MIAVDMKVTYCLVVCHDM